MNKLLKNLIAWPIILKIMMFYCRIWIVTHKKQKILKIEPTCQGFWQQVTTYLSESFDIYICDIEFICAKRQIVFELNNCEVYHTFNSRPVIILLKYWCFCFTCYLIIFCMSCLLKICNIKKFDIQNIIDFIKPVISSGF